MILNDIQQHDDGFGGKYFQTTDDVYRIINAVLKKYKPTNWKYYSFSEPFTYPYRKAKTNKLYRLWWRDGGDQTMFGNDDIGKMALRFDFDPNDLLTYGEVTFTDGDGDEVGGVVTDG